MTGDAVWTGPRMDIQLIVRVLTEMVSGSDPIRVGLRQDLTRVIVPGGRQNETGVMVGSCRKQSPADLLPAGRVFSRQTPDRGIGNGSAPDTIFHTERPLKRSVRTGITLNVNKSMGRAVMTEMRSRPVARGRVDVILHPVRLR